MIRYFPTAGDRHGWAIDEDLRLIRAALSGIAAESPIARAGVVHCPFWAGLELHDPRVLGRRFVIAHADNPPFFYLTQPGFARVQQTVDLWVARSREAKEQFDALALPSVLVPYAIDGALFFPIEDRAAIRERLGIPEGSYVIGNFHRDSEGSDLGKPKLQKAPELFVEVCRGLVAAGAPVHVLLAGPRRHWIRRALAGAGVPFTFAGDAAIAGDDFGPNILPRERLNELTNACDLYLVPSRWEGGPQSAMEAAACKTKILSPPLGVARDILEPESIFGSAPEAREKILADIREGFLDRTVEPQYLRWKASHTSEAMAAGLRALYRGLGSDPRFLAKKISPRFTDSLLEFGWGLRRRFRKGAEIGALEVMHERGGDPDLEEIVASLKSLPCGGAGRRLKVAGFARDPRRLVGIVKVQFAGSNFGVRDAIPGATILFPSAQDAANFRSGGGTNPALVCPVPREPDGEAGPLVVPQGDLRASGRIARAMASGRPIVYPAGSACYYQAFHAGVPYVGEKDAPRAAEVARANERELVSYARPPETKGVGAFLGALAREVGV